jgi:hypothetical protein
MELTLCTQPTNLLRFEMNSFHGLNYHVMYYLIMIWLFSVQGLLPQLGGNVFACFLVCDFVHFNNDGYQSCNAQQIKDLCHFCSF